MFLIVFFFFFFFFLLCGIFIVALGVFFLQCGSFVKAHRLSSCGVWAQQLQPVGSLAVSHGLQRVQTQ